MDINRKKYSHDKMTDLLNSIVDKYMDEIPEEVQFKLPKLEKVGI
jgi:hypothetical protein